MATGLVTTQQGVLPVSQKIRQKNFSAYSNPSVYHPINLSLTFSTGPCLHLTSTEAAKFGPFVKGSPQTP